MALHRLRQRHRHRRGVRRQGVRHLPAPARPRRLQRHRHRSSACARRSSSTTAAPSGSTRPTPAGPDSGSPCPPPLRPNPMRSQLPFWKEHTSDTSRRAIDVLLVEDDPGRRAHHPGSVRAQQDQQQSARRPRRRGGPGLPLPAGSIRGRAAARPDPARPEPAEVRRQAAAGEDQVRQATCATSPSLC